MKLQERIKSYKFWVGLSASLVFVLQWIGKAFGFEISAEIVNGITMGFCSVLMVLGFVEKPNKKQNNDSSEAVSIDNLSEISSNDEKEVALNNLSEISSNDEKEVALNNVSKISLNNLKKTNTNDVLESTTIDELPNNTSNTSNNENFNNNLSSQTKNSYDVIEVYDEDKN